MGTGTVSGGPACGCWPVEWRRTARLQHHDHGQVVFLPSVEASPHSRTSSSKARAGAMVAADEPRSRTHQHVSSLSRAALRQGGAGRLLPEAATQVCVTRS